MMRHFARSIVFAGALAISSQAGTARAAAPPPLPPDQIAQQIVDTFVQLFGDHPGYRITHAKGIVCNGKFTPSASAAAISKAAHLHGEPVSVVVRFSDSTGIPVIPDGDPHANPKGMAIRFTMSDGNSTDIVANSANGFPAPTPIEFLAFLKALDATHPDSPHPNAFEQYLGAHPDTAKFVMTPTPTPTSFGTERYFGNNAFKFVNQDGKEQFGRYQIVPVAGESHMDDATSAKQAPNFLMDEIKDRLSKGPVEFRLIVQLAAAGDPTDDTTKVWPNDRPTVELGTISLTSVDPKSDEVQRELAFDPTNLVDGIELSDDPLLPMRSTVYALAAKRRH
jgi:catalase